MYILTLTKHSKRLSGSTLSTDIQGLISEEKMLIVFYIILKFYRSYRISGTHIEYYNIILCILN